MDQETPPQLQGKSWQPKKLLQRFRARVTALSSWEKNLPVEREVEQASNNSPYACDVAVLCADATPSSNLLQSRLTRAATPRERHVLNEAHQRLQTLYSLGGVPPQPHQIKRIFSAVATAHNLAPAVAEELQGFFSGPMSDALCCEQVVGWLDGAEFRLHLYGPHFEDHPNLLPFVHYYSGTEAELQTIYQASRICLRLTRKTVDDPLFAAGIRHGAFFLMRFFPEDVIERIYKPIHEFCTHQNIGTDEQLREQASPAIAKLLDFAGRTLGASPFEIHDSFVESLHQRSLQGFHQWPGGLWDEYEAVAFSSKDELLELIGFYLANAPDRRRIAGAMRRTFCERAVGSTGTTTAEAVPVKPAPAAGEVAA